jgi:hypothetical protein
MDYEGEWGGGGPGHSWALKRHERSTKVWALDSPHLPLHTNYLLTYGSYVPVYNRFHRGEWITRASGGEGALDTPGPLNGTSEVIHSPPLAQVIHSPLRNLLYTGP